MVPGGGAAGVSVSLLVQSARSAFYRVGPTMGMAHVPIRPGVVLAAPSNMPLARRPAAMSATSVAAARYNVHMQALLENPPARRLAHAQQPAQPVAAVEAEYAGALLASARTKLDVAAPTHVRLPQPGSRAGLQ